MSTFASTMQIPKMENLNWFDNQRIDTSDAVLLLLTIHLARWRGAEHAVSLGSPVATASLNDRMLPAANAKSVCSVARGSVGVSRLTAHTPHPLAQLKTAASRGIVNLVNG